MTAWRWLESTARLQAESFGFDASRHDVQTQAWHIKENFVAAIVELVEMLNEVKWKYWSHEAAWVRRDKVLEEAVDVAHFLGNVLVEIGVTDDEWEEAYQAKQEENRERQRRKYESKQSRGEQ
jgi:hypothetical protein